MQMRDLTKMSGPNDGTRTLTESSMVPEVAAALAAFKPYFNGVLIGGMALSFWIKPRYTQDIDILFASDSDIPAEVPGFKRTRSHAFQHNQTHVEVELVTPTLIKVSPQLVAAVERTAVDADGIRVAGPGGLIALKLVRYSLQDRADIDALLKLGTVDMAPFLPLLSDQQRQRFIASEEQAKSEPDQAK
jgi:hypothetical protein